MEDKKYFYLNGPESLGPFTLNEIVEKNLSRETLIWTEGEAKWKPILDFPEFNKKVPPPPPITIGPTKPEINLIPVESSDVKGMVVLKISLIVILLLALLWLASYSFVEKEKKVNYSEINNRIDKVFNGKSTILDGEKYGVKGTLRELPDNNKGFLRLGIESDRELRAVFSCTSGGFTIYKLTRATNGFDKEIIESSDMGYKEPKSLLSR